MRDSIEKTPFEAVCTFASKMIGDLDVYKSENIQLNLQRIQLQQELLNIQQALLAGGSNAAKTILSKLSNVTLTDEGVEGSSSSTANKNLNMQHASLLAEKSQLEKKIFDLQEEMTSVLKSKSDAVSKIVDLKSEIDETLRVNKHLTSSLEQREREVAQLKLELQSLDSKFETLKDEHQALSLCYKGLEKKHQALQIECDGMRKQILAVKQEDAERLNAENALITQLQQEKNRRELEAKVGELTAAQLAKQAAGDPSALNLAQLENFETLDDDLDFRSFNAMSRIPTTVEFSYDGHDGETWSVHWYCCSGIRDDYLATGGADRKVKIWKIADGGSNQITFLLGSNAGITSLDVEADAILASSNDMATRVWSISNNYKLIRTLTGHSAKVYSAKFLGVPNKVASGSHDRTIKIWDLIAGSCIRTYFAGSSCYDVVYNNYQVITGHFDGKIRCWDLNKPNDNEFTAQIVLPSKITSMDISKDGTKLLCSLRDNTIKCLDLRRMEVIQTYSDDKFRIGTDACRARFSIDGQYVACGSNDGSLYVWNVNTAKVEKILSGNVGPMIACCWSPDGKRMATVGKKISVWV